MLLKYGEVVSHTNNDGNQNYLENLSNSSSWLEQQDLKENNEITLNDNKEKTNSTEESNVDVTNIYIGTKIGSIENSEIPENDEIENNALLLSNSKSNKLITGEYVAIKNDENFYSEDEDRSSTPFSDCPDLGGGDNMSDVSDSEDSVSYSAEERRSRPVPRGIHNPNYPGFQHLAYTLQEYTIDSPNSYTDTEDLLAETKMDQIHNILNTEKISNQEMNNNDELSSKNNLDSNNELSEILTENENNINDLSNHFYVTIDHEIVTLENKITDQSQMEKSNSGNEFREINTCSDFQKDLTALKREIYESIQKPLAETLQNISEVVNNVIHSMTDDKERKNEVIGNFFKVNNCEHDVSKESNDEKSEISYSFDKTNLENETEKKDNKLMEIANDAYMSSCKDSITEPQEIDEIKIVNPAHEDEISNITAVTGTSEDNNCRKNEAFINNSQVLEVDATDVENASTPTKKENSCLSKKTTSPYKLISKPEESIKKYDDSVNGNMKPKRKSKAEKEMEKSADAFDIYNIESALPQFGMDAIEKHLTVVKEEERRA